MSVHLDNVIDYQEYWRLVLLLTLANGNMLCNHQGDFQKVREKELTTYVKKWK